MAFWFQPGGPQVGAVRALALVAGLMTLATPGVASDAGIALFPDPAIPNPTIRAGALAGVVAPGCGWARLDGGRFSV
jgi:hypothetical protein